MPLIRIRSDLIVHSDSIDRAGPNWVRFKDGSSMAISVQVWVTIQSIAIPRDSEVDPPSLDEMFPPPVDEQPQGGPEEFSLTRPTPYPMVDFAVPPAEPFVNQTMDRPTGFISDGERPGEACEVRATASERPRF